MRLKDLTAFAMAAWKGGNRQTLCILGRPGTGKTSVGRDISVAMTEHVRSSGDPTAKAAVCKVVDLSSCLPEDLNGLPYRDGNKTLYAPQSWMSELCEEGAYGVLILDDLPAASPAVQVAARQISLERRVHEARLSEGVMVIVTGNRREDKSNASTLPAHFRNSVMLLGVDVDADEWFTWAGAQADIDPLIPAFLRYKSSHLAQTPADADRQGAFATPRTWAMLGRIWKIADAQSVGFEAAAGLVGEGVATEFAAFAKLRDSLVDPRDVLANPKKAIPAPKAVLNGPDKLIACVTGIAEITSAIQKKEGKAAKASREGVTAFMKALAWVTQSDREYVSVGVNTFLSNGGDVTLLVKVAGEQAKDPEVQPLLTFLAAAFKSSPVK